MTNISTLTLSAKASFKRRISVEFRINLCLVIGNSKQNPGLKVINVVSKFKGIYLDAKFSLKRY